MIDLRRISVSTATICCLAVVLGGCSMGSSRVANSRTMSEPETLTPVTTSAVASNDLPTIGANGQPVTTGQVDPNLTGDPVMGGNIGDPVTTASTDGSFVTLDTMGSISNTPGRDLAGGLTVQKLLGGWTIVSGADQCKLNLTQTAKSGTNRYRASTPACSMAGLKVVASWQLAGSQVQLFDENGDMIAALILSGNRFIGTLAGGQGISMVG